MGPPMGKKTESKKKSSEKWIIGKFCFQLLCLYLLVNFFVQIARKPTEIASLTSFWMFKTPTQTWNSYGNYFRDAGTDAIPADFLAALAHVESNGNPWASPGWRFKLNAKVFDFYAPSTTAVGLYQFLDETFRAVSAADVFSTRLSAQASTRIAAAYLNRELSKITADYSLKNLSPDRKQTLAAVIHLCGKQKAAQLASIGSCGAHQPQVYTQRVLSLKRTFAQLAARDDRSIASIR